MEVKTAQQRFSFGAFTADVRTGELYKDGVRIRIQVQPFKILKVFLEHPNRLITREELKGEVWPSDTFVDFERGLNKAINKLRDALCDTSDAPKFIETIPKRGYRFIAQVEVADKASDIAETSTDALHESRTGPASRLKLAVVIAASVLLLAGFVLLIRREPALRGDSYPSIAVVPFTSQVGDNEYGTAEALTDSFINDLALVPKLRVISHASVFQYRNRSVDPHDVGQQLGVAAVLTGRLTQGPSGLSLALELTQTANRRRLWGKNYALDTLKSANLPPEAANEVAEALRLQVVPVRQQSTRSTPNAPAQQLYLKGRYYFFKETPEDVLRARKLFQEAIDREPMFAQAYAALGDTYDWMATEGFQPLSEVLPQAQASKTKANEIDDSLAEVHSSLASLHLVRWEFSQAEPEFKKAIQLNPNYFEAHRLYSIYLRSMKRFPEALQHAKLCEQLNPLLMPVKSHLALTYYYAKQYELAAEQYRLILKDDPGDASAHGGLSAVLLKLGKEREAIQELQQALTLAGDVEAARALERTYMRSGLRAAQQQLLRSELAALERLSKNTYISPVEFAYRFALLGDKDKAMAWLERAYSERSPQLFNLNVDPDYDDLRNDPRFSDLLGRLHLPS